MGNQPCVAYAPLSASSVLFASVLHAARYADHDKAPCCLTAEATLRKDLSSSTKLLFCPRLRILGACKDQGER